MAQREIIQQSHAFSEQQIEAMLRVLDFLKKKKGRIPIKVSEFKQKNYQFIVENASLRTYAPPGGKKQIVLKLVGSFRGEKATLSIFINEGGSVLGRLVCQGYPREQQRGRGRIEIELNNVQLSSKRVTDPTILELAKEFREAGEFEEINIGNLASMIEMEQTTQTGPKKQPKKVGKAIKEGTRDALQGRLSSREYYEAHAWAMAAYLLYGSYDDLPEEIKERLSRKIYELYAESYKRRGLKAGALKDKGFDLEKLQASLFLSLIALGTGDVGIKTIKNVVERGIENEKAILELLARDQTLIATSRGLGGYATYFTSLVSEDTSRRGALRILSYARDERRNWANADILNEKLELLTKKVEEKEPREAEEVAPPEETTPPQEEQPPQEAPPEEQGPQQKPPETRKPAEEEKPEEKQPEETTPPEEEQPPQEAPPEEQGPQQNPPETREPAEEEEPQQTAVNIEDIKKAIQGKEGGDFGVVEVKGNTIIVERETPLGLGVAANIRGDVEEIRQAYLGAIAPLEAIAGEILRNSSGVETPIELHLPTSVISEENLGTLRRAIEEEHWNKFIRIEGNEVIINIEGLAAARYETIREILELLGFKKSNILGDSRRRDLSSDPAEQKAKILEAYETLLREPRLAMAFLLALARKHVNQGAYITISDENRTMSIALKLNYLDPLEARRGYARYELIEGRAEAPREERREEREGEEKPEEEKPGERGEEQAPEEGGATGDKNPVYAQQPPQQEEGGESTGEEETEDEGEERSGDMIQINPEDMQNTPQEGLGDVLVSDEEEYQNP